MKVFNWNSEKNRILIDDYAYLVPYVENDTEIFLKTIIPSRKAAKEYLRGAYE